MKLKKGEPDFFKAVHAYREMIINNTSREGIQRVKSFGITKKRPKGITEKDWQAKLIQGE